MMRHPPLARLLLVCAVLSACDADTDLGAGDVRAPIATAPQVAVGSGMVSSAHPLATRAGQQMLEQGGNAADAAVAAGFALAVVENSMNGLGGRAQILLRTADGSVEGIDAQTELTDLYRQPWIMLEFSGVDVVGVPGLVAGLVELHDRHGRLSLGAVMEPAIDYAKDGVDLLPGEASRHLRGEDAIRKDPVLAAVFLKDDAIRGPGDRFEQPDLAATLKLIADGGHDAFYTGEIALRIDADMVARDGPLRARHLAAYQAREATLVSTSYRGYEVVGITAPGNGTAVIAALNVLGGLPMSALSESQWAQTISETMSMVMEATVFDDPNDEDHARTISGQRADEFRAQLTIGRRDLARAASSRTYRHDLQVAEMRMVDVDWSGASRGADSHHTTHHTSIDAEGMVVSITQTLGPNLGAKVMTDGLGFLYAQTGGIPRWLASQGAGDRPRTNIAPTIVLKDGEPVMALGAAGGLMIPPAIVQVISRVIDQGMALEDAIAAPRIAPKFSRIPPGYLREEADVETTPHNGWSEEDLAAMRELGMALEGRRQYAMFGRVNAVGLDEKSGRWKGVADPDWEGSAAGPR